MDHSYFQDRISAFLDDSLPLYEQEVVSKHVDQCEACQSLANQLAKVDQLVENYSGLREDDYWESSARMIEEKIFSSTKETHHVSRSGVVARLFGQRGVAWKVTALAASMALITFIALHEKDITQNVELFDDNLGLEKQIPVVDSTSDIGKLEPLKAREHKRDLNELNRINGYVEPEEESSMRKSAPVRTGELPKEKKSAIGDVARPSDVKVRSQADKLAPAESVEETVGIITKEAETSSPNPVREEKTQTETKGLAPGLRRERILKSIVVPRRATETLRTLSTTEKASLKIKLRDAEPADAEDEVSVGSFHRQQEPDSVTQQLLTYWRERRNELERPTAQESLAKSGVKSLAVEDEEKVRHSLDSILLVCHYNIARLTSDSVEYKASVDHIMDFFEADLRWLAEHLLDSLGENK